VKKFTDLFVKNLKPRESEYTVRESDGFAVRVRPTGGKSFLFIYDFLNKRRNFTLGSYPAMSLKEARQAHRKAQSQIVQGIDPAEAKRQQTIARKIQLSKDAAEPTIKALAAEYLEHAKRHKRSWLQDEIRLRKYVLSEWGDLKATRLPTTYNSL
jgi:hypothetical protein